MYMHIILQVPCVKVKMFVHTMLGKWGTSTLILYLGSRWTWVANFMSQLLYHPGKGPWSWVGLRTGITNLLSVPGIEPWFLLYMITLCTSFDLTSLLWYVKFLTGYWGSSLNHTWSSLFVYQFIYFYLMCNVWTCSVNHIKSLSNWRKTSSHFIPEHVICCFRLSHYPPPHSYCCY
jgi:hypothetical protein